VALSILAELVGALRTGGLSASAAEEHRPSPAQAVDPVCGMTVTVMPDTPQLVVGGETFWFCNPHCRDEYAAKVGA
jgi:xanthine dehydrogenase accessory factor